MRRLILLTFIFCFALLSCKDQKNTVTSTNSSDQLETLKSEKGHDGKPDGYSGYKNSSKSSVSTQSQQLTMGQVFMGLSQDPFLMEE